MLAKPSFEEIKEMRSNTMAITTGYSDFSARSAAVSRKDDAS
jgi:hypothetical protein